MKLGLNVANFGPTANPAILRDWVTFAEDNGFALAMMSDHVAPTRDVSNIYPPPFYDPFTTLAWLGGLTQRVMLGTSVSILAYRHPLLTARMAANIDQFTGGRFVLGVGVGWSEPEYAALGIPFGKRGRITDEYLAAIVDAWNDEVVTHEGEFARYHDVSTGPRPVQAPHPPIWVGGSAPNAIRRAARFGQAWHPINEDLQWLRSKGLPALSAACQKLARPVPEFTPRIRARLTSHDLPEAGRLAGTGSVAQIRSDIAALFEMGAGHVILDTNPDHPADRRPPKEDRDALRRIAEGILA